MKVDRPPLWEPEEEAYLRLHLGRRLPGKELWADGKGSGGRRVCPQAEVSSASWLSPLPTPQHKVCWKRRQEQTLSIWSAPRWGEGLSPVRWGALEKASYQMLREQGSGVRESHEGCQW